MTRVLIFITLLLVGNIAFPADNKTELCDNIAQFVLSMSELKNEGIDKNIINNIHDDITYSWIENTRVDVKTAYVIRGLLRDILNNIYDNEINIVEYKQVITTKCLNNEL